MPASMPIMRMLSDMSPFTMWLNSWPITPCSSSRVSVSSVPRVTAMIELDTSYPAAKALMPFSSSITYTAGTRAPAAMAISSTTLRSRRSSGSRVAGSRRRAPIIPATAAPPPARSITTLTLLTPKMTATVTRVVMTKIPEGTRCGTP